jgi:hypothetical protein
MSRGALTGVGETRAKNRSGSRAYVLSKGKGVGIRDFDYYMAEHAQNHSP